MHHTSLMDPESAELMSIPYKTCSNLTDGEVTTIALAGGITATVCAVASFTVLVILALVNCYHHRVCETVVKRLVVGNLASSVPFQFVGALNLIYNFQPEQENFCKAVGFLYMYYAGVLNLFMLVITLVLFLTVCGATTSWKCRYDATFTMPCCSWKINKLETVLFISVFCLPLLFDWIPFTTDSYGPNGPMCLIRRLENNCSIHNAGLIEMVLVSLGSPVGLPALGLFIVSLCLLGYAIKNAKAKKLNKMGITDSILFLAIILIASLLATAILYCSQWKTPEPFLSWMFTAIFTPIVGFLVGLALLVVIHFPFSSVITCLCCNCHRHTHAESDQATIRASSQIQQPSYTTWNPPHSTNTESLLASDEQLQEYGSMASYTTWKQPSYTTWNSPHSTNTDSQTALLASEEQLSEYGSMA